MKKIFMMAFVFTLILTMSACGGKDTGGGLGNIEVNEPSGASEPADPAQDDQGQEEEATPADPAGPMVFGNVTEMFDEQDRLFDIHYDTLVQDAWLPIDVGMFGATYSFYYFMFQNPDNKDGKFGDTNSLEGFVYKQGDIYNVAQDFVYVDAIGEVNIGDRVIVNGEANIAEGEILDEVIQERDGVIVKHTRNNQQFFVGKMVLLNQEIYNTGNTNRDARINTIRFIVSTEQSYEYVYGFLEYGADAEIGFMGFDPSMTTADVRDILAEKGYEIFLYGKAENGKIVDLL